MRSNIISNSIANVIRRFSVVGNENLRAATALLPLWHLQPCLVGNLGSQGDPSSLGIFDGMDTGGEYSSRYPVTEKPAPMQQALRRFS